jgi:hypothetical protein
MSMREEALDFEAFGVGVVAWVSQLYILLGEEGSRDDGAVFCNCDVVWGKVLDFWGRKLESQLFLLLSSLFSSLILLDTEESLDDGWGGGVEAGVVEVRLILNMPMMTMVKKFETLHKELKFEHAYGFFNCSV